MGSTFILLWYNDINIGCGYVTRKNGGAMVWYGDVSLEYGEVTLDNSDFTLEYAQNAIIFYTCICQSEVS